MTQTGAFALGVITGIAALGVTAVMVKILDNRHIPYIPLR